MGEITPEHVEQAARNIAQRRLESVEVYRASMLMRLAEFVLTFAIGGVTFVTFSALAVYRAQVMNQPALPFVLASFGVPLGFMAAAIVALCLLRRRYRRMGGQFS